MQIKLIMHVVVALHLIEKALTQITLTSSSTKINKHRGALSKFPIYFYNLVCANFTD